MARVTVNRFWQMYFGVGIVKTAEDFGSQGECPSHPELLDWLATEFMRTGWDVKALQKTIVMSATYRQASRTSPELRAKDPDNRLLARGPSVRLSADIVRDQALAVAGLLVNKIGGPSVKPYQPEGLWNEIGGGGAYVQDHGDDLYRRSLYTFWRRTIPPPSMANFDASARESHMVRPVLTNTPLQALDLMNDVTFVEAARVFAERVMKEGGTTPADRIAYAFRAGHGAHAEGRQSLRSSWMPSVENLELFTAKPDAALKYVSHGEFPRDADTERQRAGGLHQRDEPDPQSERSGDEGVAMDPRRGLCAARDPAAFSRTAGVGIGMAALAELLQCDLFAQSAAAPRRRDRRPAGVAAFCAEGQAGDLPVPERRPFAARSVRLQAAARQDARHRSARLDPEGSAVDRDDRGANELSGRAVDLHVRAVRAIGRVAQRAAAAHREDRGRLVLHQVDAYRADQSRSGGDVRADRVSAGGPAEPGRVGLLRAGHDQQDLPAFVVMITGNGQSLAERQWGTGFIPSRYQGVKLRSVGDPVLYVSNPAGFDRSQRARFIQDLEQAEPGSNSMPRQNPEIATRIAQYEMAFRMQTSVPELTDLSKEPERTFELYGPDSRKPGTYAANCLMARRLAERGVRFIQLYHRAWDHHSGLPKAIRTACQQTDQPSAGLIQDLKERGLLDETLVIWAGEFGRTVYSQGKLTADDYGRDHHPRAFTIWMAGGGVKPGITLGETDDYGYNITEDPVHIHDLNATILRCLGIDHTRLTYKYQGRNFRLTDTAGRVFQKALNFNTVV